MEEKSVGTLIEVNPKLLQEALEKFTSSYS